MPAQSGNRLSTVHPPYIQNTIANLMQKRGLLRTIAPNTPPEIINVHKLPSKCTILDGSYAGINEIVFDFKPWLDWYSQTTGQRLVSAMVLLQLLTQQVVLQIADTQLPARGQGKVDSGHSAPAQAQGRDATRKASEH